MFELKDDLKDLYREVIIDHNRKPRNFGKLEDASQVAEGYNPLCGDKLLVYLKIHDNQITDIRFDGSGCAISVASASLMTEALKGEPLQTAAAMFDAFHHLVTGSTPDQAKSADVEPLLGKLTVLAGVRAYPARVKCATLCWHTVRSAIAGDDIIASTE